MADQNKFEEMLERLINEDKDGAEELFHEIVVEKSRDIYESLLESDIEEDEEVDEAADEEVDEAADEEVDESDEDLDESADEDDDDDEEVDEGFDLDEFEVEADDDPADDMMGDLMGGGDDEGDDDPMGGDDKDIEDRVMDLEDALDELTAEFEKIEQEMGGGEADDEGDMDDMDGDDEGDEEPEEEAYAFEADEEVEETADEEVEESKGKRSEAEQMREYVEKIQGGELGSKIGGDNGANAKSPVAGKNDMGGTASNLNQGKDNEAGDHAGLGDMNAKDETAGNVNVPGGKASKANKAMPKGHGAEKKGGGEAGANSKSTIGS